MRFASKLLCTCVALFASSATRADVVQLTFNELPADTPVDGLSFRGLNFAFSDPAGGPVVSRGDAFYNSSVVTFPSGTASGLVGSVLEGDSAGLLTIDFVLPTTLLSFNLGLGSADTLNSGVVIELFDRSMRSLGVSTIATTPALDFGPSEGSFSSGTNTLISRAVLDFDDNAGRFYLDSLRFNPVPEPSGLALMGIGGTFFLLRLRTRAAT